MAQRPYKYLVKKNLNDSRSLAYKTVYIPTSWELENETYKSFFIIQLKLNV